MNADKPVGSKYLNRIWQEFNKHVHKDKLKNISARTPSYPAEPDKMPHLSQNGK